MSLRIRAARSTDAGKLGAMISDAVLSNAWKPQLHSEAEDIAHMGALIDRGWIRVCERLGKVVGFIARDAQKIQSLYVTRDAQNSGIGTALLKEAMQMRDDLELWTFAANTGAQRFYLRHGFAEVERTDGAGNEEGLPDIRYVWTASEGERSDG